MTARLLSVVIAIGLFLAGVWITLRVAVGLPVAVTEAFGVAIAVLAFVGLIQGLSRRPF